MVLTASCCSCCSGSAALRSPRLNVRFVAFNGSAALKSDVLPELKVPAHRRVLVLPFESPCISRRLRSLVSPALLWGHVTGVMSHLSVNQVSGLPGSDPLQKRHQSSQLDHLDVPVWRLVQRCCCQRSCWCPPAGPGTSRPGTSGCGSPELQLKLQIFDHGVVSPHFCLLRGSKTTCS